MKRLPYAYVKKYFESVGYTLLSKAYLSYWSGLDFICDKGHKHSISFGMLKRGQRCAKCLHNSLRLDYSLVKEQFEKEGYILLTKEYINSVQKLEVICPNNHRRYMTSGNWRSGYRCAECSGNIRHTIEYVRDSFAKEGYKLLSEKYINQKQKLFFECPFGHQHSITWSDWSTGYRCRTCYAIKISGSGNHAWCGGDREYCSVWKDEEYKEDIKIRDGYKCINPYCEGKKGNAGQLTIHHIDYNKKNCNLNNLITVCRSCNSKANTDREWHEAWYKAIMSKRYKCNY